MKNTETMQNLLGATARAAQLLLRERDPKVAIPESLRFIGEAAGADRSYLFRCSYDDRGEGFVSQAYEWNSGQAEPQIDNPDLQDLPFSAVADFMEPLQRGAIFFGVVRLLQPDLKAYLEPQNIKSLVIVPILAEGRLWGFVGFDACAEERVWNPDEQAALLAYAASLGASVERSLAENRLIRATEVAESENRAKSTFVANMSHEIRTPLHTILGFAELLAERKTDALTAQYVRSIKTAGESLLSLSNAILDLSRMDAFQLVLYPEPTDLSMLLAEFQTIYNAQARAQGLAFDMHGSPDLPEIIYADAARLRQILFNLLGNAFQFTERGWIRVEASSVKVDDSHVDLRISVIDSGPGISATDLEHIFTPFVTGNPETARQYGSIGLGLTISRRLASIMGGSIEVRSEVGKGSAFTLMLPNLAVVSSADPRWMEKRAVPLVGQFLPSDVLLIEDTESNRTVVRSFLKDSGLTLHEAPDGARGIAFARQLKPALILLDLHMPVMDGFTALRHLRADEATKSIPVIVMSSGMDATDTATIGSQAQGAIEKPFTRSRLLTLMAGILPTLVPVRRPGPAAAAATTESGGPPPFRNGADLRASLMEGWNAAAEFMANDEIAAFAARAKAEGLRLDDSAAIAWADALAGACARFDLPLMESLFSEFPARVG